MMPFFDCYIAVDWSASNAPKSGKDSIWSCLGPNRAAGMRTSNHRTRHAAESWLLGQLLAAVRAGERVLVGFDFPYAYPAGFAAALGVEGEPWEAVWTYLDRHVRDDEHNVNNRFDVAAEINSRLGPDAPFWGRPIHLLLASLPFRKEVVYRARREAGGLPEWRQVEEQLHTSNRWPQSVWKLAGAGAVGSQSLVGIPVVRRLRDHAALRDVSQVWPFEVRVPQLRVGMPAVVHAEIWPSIVSFTEEEGSCPDEQQVRAVVRHWRELDRTDRLVELFAAAPDTRTVRREEGWVLGVPSPGADFVPALSDRLAAGSARQPSHAASARPAAAEEAQITSAEIGVSVIADRETRPMLRVMRKHVSGYNDVPNHALLERINKLEALLKDPKQSSLRPAAEHELRACRRALEPDFAHTKIHHATNCWYVDSYEAGRFPGRAKRKFILVPADTVPDGAIGCQYCESGREATATLKQPAASARRMPSALARVNAGSPGASIRAVSGLDYANAEAFIAAVPDGSWTSYKDVATAAGNPNAYMAIGNWLRQSGGSIDNYWRVINSDGHIPDAFASHAPGLPRDSASASDRLRNEGVRFSHASKASQTQRFRYEHWTGRRPPPRQRPHHDPAVTPTGIQIGATVRIRDLDTGEQRKWTLVAKSNASPADGKLSIDSPIGVALRGKNVGDTATATTPKGPRRYSIEQTDNRD